MSRSIQGVKGQITAMKSSSLKEVEMLNHYNACPDLNFCNVYVWRASI